MYFKIFHFLYFSTCVCISNLILTYPLTILVLVSPIGLLKAKSLDTQMKSYYNYYYDYYYYYYYYFYYYYYYCTTTTITTTTALLLLLLLLLHCYYYYYYYCSTTTTTAILLLLLHYYYFYYYYELQFRFEYMQLQSIFRDALVRKMPRNSWMDGVSLSVLERTYFLLMYFYSSWICHVQHKMFRYFQLSLVPYLRREA